MPLPQCLRAIKTFFAPGSRTDLAVEHSKQNQAILSFFLRAGFQSHMTRGTIASPLSDFQHVGEPQRRMQTSNIAMPAHALQHVAH